MTAAKNSAAWLSGKGTKPFTVAEAPYGTPGALQLVVKNAAVAANAVDGAKQLLGNVLLGYLPYPFILGLDVAGTVVEVGSGVQRFKVGDRVIGSAMGMHQESKNPCEGGFQQFTVLREHLTAPLPDSISFEQGAVIPLGLMTAAYSLFHTDYLALEIPGTQQATGVKQTPKQQQTIIITAGASSVGSNAIQLAVAAGYTVYSTSSPKNFELVKSWGAAKVFDYHKSDYADDIIADLHGKHLAGAVAIGQGATEACIRILQRGSKDSKKFVAFAGAHVSSDQVKSKMAIASLVGAMIMSKVRTSIMSLTKGVAVKFVECNDIHHVDGAVGQVFTHFLPSALADRSFVPAPAPLIIGHGLDSVQAAVDQQMKGVSAQKSVVTL